jgi:hypothetical protein
MEPEDNIKGLVKSERGSSLNAFISVPYDLRAQRITMHVLSDEKVEQLISAGSPWPLAMFTLTGGVAAAILVAIYSGGIVANQVGIFWVGFWAMTVLTLAFAGSAVLDYKKTKKIKNAIKEQSKTVVTLPTVDVQSESPLR